MVKRINALIAAIFILLQFNVYAAGSLYKTEIRQIYCFKDLVRVYADFMDPDSAPVIISETSSVIGSIDDTKLVTRSVKRFSDTGEPVADIFLVDISGSIRNSQMDQVKSAIRTWASNMSAADRLAVITFGDSCTVKSDFTNDRNAINTAVDGITNNDKNTQLYGGIMEALKLAGRSDAALPKRRNIILITDGVNDYNGGVSENDVYNELQQQLIPVYSMWMSNSKANNKKGAATLNSVAGYSGGVTYDMTGKNIEAVYSQIRRDIMDTTVVDFAYNTVQPDNNKHTLNVKAAVNDKIAEDSAELILRRNDEESGTYRIRVSDDASLGEEAADSGTEDKNYILLIICIGAAVLACAAGVTAVIMVKNRRRRDYEQAPPAPVYPAYTDTSTQKTVGVTEPDPVVCKSTFPVKFTRIIDNVSAVVDMTDAMTVGRNANNSFVISAPTVSGDHAMIYRDGRRLFIEDLSSKNGTLLNGRIVKSRIEINTGDTVTFGTEEYRIWF